MTDEIPSALTPDQWAGLLRPNFFYGNGPQPFVYGGADEDGALGLSRIVGPENTDWAPLDLPAEDVPALMALANTALPDDSPHKLTRADAQLCRDLADNSGFWTDANRNALERLAAKLAALLPP